MATIQTFDRTLALRCKLARERRQKITVSYETCDGWNRVTGFVSSVRPLKERIFNPSWEIIVIEAD
jgi:hypothetical protein